jgi:hypothetical protein
VSALPVPFANAGQVDMADVVVSVTNAAGQPVAGATVTMNHVPFDPAASATSFPGCSAGESYTLGVTNATGQLSIATPYGYWDVSTTTAGATPARVWLHPQTTPIQVGVTVP